MSEEGSLINNVVGGGEEARTMSAAGPTGQKSQ